MLLAAQVPRFARRPAPSCWQDRMATLEEEKLSEVHPAYKTYKEEVSKFLPTIY